MQSPLNCKSVVELVKEIDAYEISRRWRDELGIEWRPPEGVQKIGYWRDPETGFCYYTPAEVAGGFSLYQELQKKSWYYMDEKWEFSEALAFLDAQQTSCRLLEIGVGRGGFLRKVKSLGIKVGGIELNPEMAAYVRGQGFEIYEEELSSLAQRLPSYWDVVCSFQVLEHVPDPKKFIQDALKSLKPGGLFILSVPNAEVARKLDPERSDLLDQPPHHMGHWDVNVFRSLEEIFPLCLKRVSFEPLATYHVGWFLGAWRRQAQAKYGRFLGGLALNRITTPLVSQFFALGLRKFVRGHTLLVCFQKVS